MQLEIPDRYEIIKLGPVGGQASICHARDKWLDRKVVMKAALPGSTYDAAAEVRSLAAVNSKHVVSIYDTIRDASGNILAIIEEEVEGPTLENLFATTLTTGEKLNLLYQLACGASDMHKFGRVHRDLKPNNMKVRPDKLLKIFDFGISTILADGDETLVGKGTDGYKAPELYGTPPIQVTPKCDSYSIGVIAHQLFANGTLAREFTDTPPNPLYGGISFDAATGPGKHITDTLNRALALDPTARPEASEIRDAVASEIMRDRHRAVLVSGTTPFTLDAAHRAVKVGDSGNEIIVEYSGTRFFIRNITGDVYVNNRAIQRGEELSGAMVITLGAPQLKAGRTFVTFDISHPEILI